LSPLHRRRRKEYDIRVNFKETFWTEGKLPGLLAALLPPGSWPPPSLPDANSLPRDHDGVWGGGEAVQCHLLVGITLTLHPWRCRQDPWSVERGLLLRRLPLVLLRNARKLSLKSPRIVSWVCHLVSQVFFIIDVHVSLSFILIICHLYREIKTNNKLKVDLLLCPSFQKWLCS